MDFGTILKSTYKNQQKPFRVCVGVCYRFIRCKWICSGMSHYFVTDVIIHLSLAKYLANIHLFQKILTDIPNNRLRKTQIDQIEWAQWKQHTIKVKSPLTNCNQPRL